MKKLLCVLICVTIAVAAVFFVTNSITKPAVPDNDIKTNKVTEKIIDVPAICQYPELPTGCESVAATMILQYYGENITAGEFAIAWLEYSENFYTANDKLYGPDPEKVFAGNPFTNNSYGCFAAPIVDAINRNSSVCKARKIENKTLKELCGSYIDKDIPLLIWATMGMKKSANGKTWYLEDGSLFSWIAGEHCLVFVGYNDNYYFFNDPMSGSTVAYQKKIAEKRFAELGKRAIYISK